MKKMKEQILKLSKAEEVKVDPLLNKFLWSRGRKKIPRRARVNVDVGVMETEDGTIKKIAKASFIPVSSFKGLRNEEVNNEE